MTCLAEGLPIKTPNRSAKVHPCNISENDFHLHDSRLEEPRGTASGAVWKLFFFLMASITICCSLIITVAWFTLRPKNPAMLLDSFNIPTFNLSESTLTADYNLDVTFKNPNRLWDIYFGNIEFYMYYQVHSLCGTTVKDFKLAKKKEETLNASMEQGGYWFWNNSVLNNFRVDYRTGMVSFHVEMATRLSFQGVWWLWWTEQGYVEYSCSSVNVSFENGTGGMPIVDTMPMLCHSEQ
ncbi:Late embryogenesis abundant protein, LEA-14 [Quillaja saponaria]|uniref:Late embryogenesis abundant protein, LEA-14 n=1 Tax=Quillaja saponaria TaxID=32244 RepID=A0AAD7P6J2_QUISA|nr:Late embryogenesis abundant protein, LEA-14 [Quillaja saponaria]